MFVLCLLLVIPSCTKDDPQRHLKLGNWYLQRGLVDEAIMEFREVSRLFSGDVSKLKREEYNILEGEVLTCDLTNGLLVNCVDPDPQDILTVILDIPPADGAFVLNDDGTFTYDHNCSDDPDETFFTYFVTDGEDTTLVADTVRIIIDNDPDEAKYVKGKNKEIKYIFSYITE